MEFKFCEYTFLKKQFELTRLTMNGGKILLSGESLISAMREYLKDEKDGLVGVDFSLRHFDSENLSGLQLPLTSFDKAELSFSNCQSSDFSGASFRSAKLMCVDFRGANLTNIDWSDAVIAHCDFRGAIFDEKALSKAKSVSIRKDELYFDESAAQEKATQKEARSLRLIK